MTEQPQSQNAGCGILFILPWSFFCVLVMFAHPIFGFGLWWIGLFTVGSIAQAFRSKEPHEPIYSIRERQPHHVVYRREVTVTETISQSAEFRPRQEFDPYRLKGIFRDIN
jgi:hypothetical protein